MSSLYPLKFQPILKDRIWGGTKLSMLYGKTLPEGMNLCGESWELSAVEGNISIVSNGYLAGNSIQELIEVYLDELLGGKVYSKYGLEFPLLIKLIDATDILSVQVHPDDSLAAERHHAYGKTEMWYVLEADEGAEIITGFNQTLTRWEYVELLNNGRIPGVLKREQAMPDDYFFIPAGKVHAIGTGIVLAEIQQTSDITYRIYDWDRVDSKGEGRELHTELAVDAIDFNEAYDTRQSLGVQPNTQQELVSCPYFITNRMVLDTPICIETYPRDSFTILLCIDGMLTLGYGENQSLAIAKGELVLVPAETDRINLLPNGSAKLLEVYLP